jgi:ankyrin repeat protein
LSYIQPEFVDGTLRVEILEHPDKPGVEVPVIYVRVNANIRSPTLDELNWARKQSHISAFRSQNRDTADDIRKMCNERKSDVIHRLSSTVISDSLLSELRKIPHSVNSVDSVQIAFEVFQSIISQECEDVLKLHEQQLDSAFVDKFEHSRLVTEMISTRKWASAKLLWFIEDDALAFRNILHYPLEKSYREYVSFCRNRIRKEVNDSRKRKLAFLLCKLVGLVPSQHDATKNETPIVLAVENGACAEDVELLLDAGYPVDSVTREGNSILSTAVRYGYTQTAELLIYRGADVNFMNTKDGKRTPMIFAAVHGHAGCLQLLLDCGAEPSAECLQYARQHKNFPCVDVLLNAGAIDDYGDDSSSIVSQNPALWHGSAPPRVVNDGMDQFAVPRSCSHITPISPSKARREGFPTQRPELARAKSAVILDSSAHTSRIHLFNSKLLEAAFDPIATITSVLSVKNEGIKKRYIKSILFRIVTKAFTFTFSDQVCIDVLRLILRSNPDSVSECDANGYLPLHVAVESGASLAVVVELLKAYPEAAQKRINRFSPAHERGIAVLYWTL